MATLRHTAKYSQSVLRNWTREQLIEKKITEEASIDRYQTRVEKSEQLIREINVELEFRIYGSEPPVGTVVKFSRLLGVRTTSGARWYDYAALRAGDGYWYTTGNDAGRAYAWRKLVDFVSSASLGYTDIQVLDGSSPCIVVEGSTERD